MKIKLLFLALLFSTLGWGQVNMTNTGSYSQDFNTLVNTGTPTWTDNLTIPNWYSQRSGAGAGYLPDTGTNATGNIYSYGATGSTERALGGISSGGAGDLAHGLLLRNTSASTITNLIVSYTGEQWRRAAGGAGAQTVTFFYKIAAASFTNLNPNVNAGWTAVTTLNFSSPQFSAPAAALDGNLAANKVAISATIPALSIPSNSYIMIKWDDIDHTSSDHGMAIDDLTVSWTVPCVTATTWAWDAMTSTYGWSAGIPTFSTNTIINGNYDMTIQPSFDACSVVVNSPNIVTVVANKNMNIQNSLTVNVGATVNVLNNGSIVQYNDAAINSGNININRDVSIRLQDYVYWSSPVNNFAVTSVSTGTTLNYIYKWNPSIANANAGLGNWQNANEPMASGKGYIIRAPNTYSVSSPTLFTAPFSGKPNNGIYTPTIERGSYTGANYAGTNGVTITNLSDNWNLIGNPYPSAISTLAFLTANTNIEGAVRIWTHGTLPVSGTSPFYNTYTYNYNVNDYIIYNGTATTSGPAGFNGYIAAGQAFVISMNDGPAGTATVTFNNAMRNKAYANNQFYKTSNIILDSEKHRIWLDLIGQNQQITRTVVGYIEGATQEKDRLYDAYNNYDDSQNFYSLIDDQIMVIQGRSLPFNIDDLVPMGVKIPTTGNYTIAIAAVDGLFSSPNQIIYLEDKALNIIYNISVSPYQFQADKGIINDRFVLRYNEQKISNASLNDVAVFVSNDQININSFTENIKKYEIYDVLGRKLATQNDINKNTATTTSIVRNNQALIVKVTLENGQEVTKKIIF
jgi:hypothetical protein